MNRSRYVIYVLFAFLGALGAVAAILEGKVGLGIAVMLTGLVAFAHMVRLRCSSCDSRPALFLFFVWFALFDPALFFSDALLLRRCPKCKNDVFR